MTVEEEKGYEIAEKYLRKKYGDDYVDFIETEGQSYLDGYEQGYEDCRHYAHDYYKPKWHDPRNDFPEDKRKGDEFCCKLEDKTLDLEWYEILIWDIEYQTEDIYQVPVGYMFKSLETGKDMSDYVIAWCELPKFEE